MRNPPDISITASIHDGYLVCMLGEGSYGEYFYPGTYAAVRLLPAPAR